MNQILIYKFQYKILITCIDTAFILPQLCLPLGIHQDIIVPHILKQIGTSLSKWNFKKSTVIAWWVTKSLLHCLHQMKTESILLPDCLLCICNKSLIVPWCTHFHLCNEMHRNNHSFYSILFYSILFYSILFYSILFYSISFYSILFSAPLFHLEYQRKATSIKIARPGITCIKIYKIPSTN